MTRSSPKPAASSAFTAAAAQGAALPPAQGPALLLIDIQKKYCDPAGMRGNAQTADVTKKIVSLVPAFRAAGLPFYPVYAQPRWSNTLDIDFYEFTPARHDTIIRKNADSAFAGSSIGKVLRRDGRHTLLVCGFNLNACVNDTVCDALDNGFAVWLLRDLTGNDNHNDAADTDRALARMQRGGAQITDSAAALAALSLPRAHAYRPRRPEDY